MPRLQAALLTLLHRIQRLTTPQKRAPAQVTQHPIPAAANLTPQLPMRAAAADMKVAANTANQLRTTAFLLGGAHQAAAEQTASPLSSVTEAELAALAGLLDPSHPEKASMIAQVAAFIKLRPEHRILTPDGGLGAAVAIR